MPAGEKDKVTWDFFNNNIKILVATTVREDGVDWSDGNRIVKEQSERFG